MIVETTLASAVAVAVVVHRLALLGLMLGLETGTAHAELITSQVAPVASSAARSKKTQPWLVAVGALMVICRVEAMVSVVVVVDALVGSPATGFALGMV